MTFMIVLLAIFVLLFLIRSFFSGSVKQNNTYNESTRKPNSYSTSDYLTQQQGTSSHENTGSLRYLLTKEQKCSIFISLTSIARADGDLTKREFDFLEQISKDIGFTQNDLLLEYSKMEDVFKDDRLATSYISTNLRSLTNEQKEWYVSKVDSLTVSLASEASDQELTLAADFINRMGISTERYNQIVYKQDFSQELLSHVNKRVDANTNHQESNQLKRPNEEQLSFDQRMAMVLSLEHIAALDEKIDGWEEHILQEVRDTLGVKKHLVPDKTQEPMSKLDGETFEYICDQLSTISITWKEWYVSTVKKMLYDMEHVTHDAEHKLASDIFIKMGISSEYYNKIVDKLDPTEVFFDPDWSSARLRN